MCTKETFILENYHKQLNYVNFLNNEELKSLINLNCNKYLDNIKDFTEKLCTSLNDLSTFWPDLSFILQLNNIILFNLFIFYLVINNLFKLSFYWKLGPIPNTTQNFNYFILKILIILFKTNIIISINLKCCIIY